VTGFWYLASPYSKYAAGIEEAFRAICREAALLVAAGVPVFSPIAHTHPIAVHGEIDPLAHAIWLPADRPMMNAACGLIVCQMPGWEESYGIGVEVEHFQHAGKPIVFMRPGVVPELPPAIPPERTPAKVLCRACAGTGATPGDRVCPPCGGKGTVWE